MNGHDFIAGMQAGLPLIPGPALLGPGTTVEWSERDAQILKGNADIAIHHPDAVGAAKELPCAI